MERKGTWTTWASCGQVSCNCAAAVHVRYTSPAWNTPHMIGDLTRNNDSMIASFQSKALPGSPHSTPHFCSAPSMGMHHVHIHDFQIGCLLKNRRLKSSLANLMSLYSSSRDTLARQKDAYEEVDTC